MKIIAVSRNSPARNQPNVDSRSPDNEEVCFERIAHYRGVVQIGGR